MPHDDSHPARRTSGKAALIAWLGMAIAAAPTQAQLADPTDGVPGVTIRRYPIGGDDVESISAALAAAKGWVDPGDPAANFGGGTDFAFSWHWPTNGAGGCDLSAASVSFSATVTLPRLSGNPPPEVRARWDRYVAALARHEARHVRYAYDARAQILAAIRSARCATAEAAAQRALAAINAAERAIDVETRHGATDGATFP